MFLQQVSLLSSDISQISRFDAFSWETQRAAWQHLAWALCNEMKQGCCGRCLLFFSSCGSCLVKRNFVSFNLPPDSKRFIQHLFGSMGMPRSYNGTCWTCLFCLGISGSGFWQISTCIGAVSLDTVWASQWLSDARDLGNSVGLWPVQHLLRLLMKSSFHAETLERLDLLSKVVPCAGQPTMAQICFDVDVSGTGWNCHSSSVHIGRHFRRWKELEDWLNYHRKGVISVIACFGNDYMCKWWYVCLLVEYGYQITKAESKIVSWLIDVQLFHCPSFVNQSRRGKLFGVSGR